MDAPLIEKLYRDIEFSAESVIADVGSGTGKFAKQILEKRKGNHAK